MKKLSLQYLSALFTDNKILFRLVKYVILILSYSYIAWKLYSYGNLIEYFNTIELTFRFVLLLFIVLLLMPVNWLLEATKWKILVNNLETISLFSAVKAVFAGITVAIFTPNRIGEIPGRVFMLQKKNRIAGLVATGFGSVCQLSVTVLFGITGFICFFSMYPDRLPINKSLVFFISLGGLLSFLALMLIFFMNTAVFSKILRSKYINKYRSLLQLFTKYETIELIKVFLYSIFRYIVFTIQFFVLLLIFNVNITLPDALLAISMSYFTLTFIPSITLAEIGIRSSVSMFFIGMFAGSTPGIVVASSCLWIINLVLPALAGSLFIVKIKE